MRTLVLKYVASSIVRQGFKPLAQSLSRLKPTEIIRRILSIVDDHKTAGERRYSNRQGG